MKEVDFKRGVVIGMYLIKTLKEKGGESLCTRDVGEDGAVFVTCIDGIYAMYINPRILKKGEGYVLFEYTDEYGNFNIKEVGGKLGEVVVKEVEKLCE